MKNINLTALNPHPHNPRLTPREDVVEQIVAQINAGGFDEAHALIVRPIEGGYQIISGHHRKLAAERAGLTEVPCWVREMDDATAYMELVRANAQSELTALERGLHALHSGMDQRSYAASVGRPEGTVNKEVQAAKVSEAVVHMYDDLSSHFRALTEIHAAPRWLWKALVGKMVAEGMTVEQTRKMVAGVKDVADLPEWADADGVAKSLIEGEATVSMIEKLGVAFEKAIAAITKAEINAEAFIEKLTNNISAAKPYKLSQVNEICLEIINEQDALVKQARQSEIDAQKRNEEIAAKTARMRKNVSLEEWKNLGYDEREALLNLEKGDGGLFNKQENDAIEWAQWSWNPVTGCLHECSYCYARDIANSSRMASVYPNGFEPTFRPSMLLAPRSMKVPKEAANDARYKNVFTCSMADLFGRWVPKEWIEAVFREVRAAPEWNFLFLTKFPKRMAEFDIPPNAWMGTTVDLQARVANAEAAFANVKSGVRWLSVEPMLEPLKFNHLDRFDWIVIGGSSSSSATDGTNATPEWKPPFEWVLDLVQQAQSAGVKIYFKTNLLGPRITELPFDAPTAPQLILPSEFQYLGKKDVA